MRYTILIFLSLFSFKLAIASLKPSAEIDYNYPYHPPMAIDLVLAGNFGEMRDNHFHSGLDMKTGGTEGHKLYAVEEGYVSRIRISPWGYGLAVYINHPNGITSLYGHMQSFSTKIDSLAYAKQKEGETYILDADVLADSVYVKKGEIIGLSGNSGSSSAPHLHFEMRETASELALNPLLFKSFKVKIADTTPPTITGIKLYAVSDKGYMIPGKSQYFACKLVGSSLVINEGNPIDINALLTANAFLAIGVHSTDKLNGAGNVCGIFNSQLSKDDATIFEMKIDHINFEQSRFLNTHQDYFEFDQNNKHIHKHFKTVVNPLNIYGNQNGLVSLANASGNYNLTVYDVHGNKTNLKFNIAKPSGTYSKNPFEKTSDYYFPDSVNTVLKESFQVLMESATFYEPLQKVFRIDTQVGYLSPVYQFGEYTIPVQKKFEVRIKVPTLPANFPIYKLGIGLINDKNKLSYIHGDYIDGWVEGAPRNFGKFVIVVDSVAPVITPTDFIEGKTITKFNNLQLTIQDNLSGVMTYKAYLNGQWVLMMYDRRAAKYIIPLDKRSKPILRTGNNKLRIEATDSKGNKSEAGYTLIY